MHPRTPQKKNSLDLDYRTQITTNSYLYHNNSSIHPSIQHHPLKNSQGSINKKIAQSPQSHVYIRQKPQHINKMSLVKKYVQQEMQQLKSSKNSTPCKQKQYRDVVISEQFVKSHKLYKMLKEQMVIAETRHHRQTNALKNILEEEDNVLKGIKNNTHTMKVELWELKNQFMELKSMLEEQEEENKRLVEEYQYANRHYGGEIQEGQGHHNDCKQEASYQKGESEQKIQQSLEEMENHKLEQLQQIFSKNSENILTFSHQNQSQQQMYTNSYHRLTLNPINYQKNPSPLQSNQIVYQNYHQVQLNEENKINEEQLNDKKQGSGEDNENCEQKVQYK